MILMPMLLVMQNLSDAQITRRTRTFAAAFARAKSARELPFARGIRFTGEGLGRDFEKSLTSFQRLLKPCSVRGISGVFLVPEGPHRGEKEIVVVMQCRSDDLYVSYRLSFKRGEIGEMHLVIDYPPTFDRPN